LKPLADDGVHFPAASVVPASYHPAQKSASVEKDGCEEELVVYARLRCAKSRHTRSTVAKNPYVMARLAVSDTTEQSLLAPSLMVFETVESNSRTPGSAQLRTVGADSANPLSQQFAGRENPALQIQVIRVIDPATGSPIQILRIVLVVPQQAGSASQSI
jgi:hypothetical protein